MADDKFLRGVNRMDWLFAVMIQTACDWYPLAMVGEVANLIGDADVVRYTHPAAVYPSVTVITTQDIVFVVSASTKNDLQWVGNVLGSAATVVPPSHGSVSAYFGSVATWQYLQIRSDVVLKLAGRRLVLIGFSLGAASVTILKDMFRRALGIDSACVAIGSPRAGTTTFASDYPTDNFAGFTVLNDVVNSVPPVLWTGLGLRNAWTPFPPFVLYAHPVAGNTLRIDGSITDGYTTVGVDEVVLGFDLGTWMKFHSQALYGNLLRTMGMPETIEDGYQGYAFAGKTDHVAAQVFDFGGIPWHWYGATTISEGGSDMTVQLTIGIRDLNVPTAFDEVYYMSGNDPEAVVRNARQSASPASPPLANLRAAFLSRQCGIYYLRANLLGGQRQSWLYKYQQPLQGLLGDSETIGDAVLYFAYSASRFFRRQMMFRGISGAWVSGDQLTNAGTMGQPLVTAFMDRLIASGLQIQTLGSASVGFLGLSAAAKATQVSDITLTLSDGVTIIPPNSLVKIEGVRQAPLLNAIWKVGGGSIAGQFTLSGSSKFSAPPVITGKVKLYSLVPVNVTSYVFNSVTHKDCGRPRFLHRGRRSVQIRRR